MRRAVHRAQRVPGRADRDRRDRGRGLPGVRQGHPLHPALRAQGGVRPTPRRSRRSRRSGSRAWTWARSRGRACGRRLARRDGDDEALDDEAQPIHEDAEVKVRPRIFFEGNLFMDIRPGTPSSPEADSGARFPPPRPPRRCRSTRSSARSRRTPARTCRSCSWATARPSTASRARRGRRPGGGPGAHRRRGAQQVARLLGGLPARHRDRQPGPAGHGGP